MGKSAAHIEKTLREAGLKMTPQRAAILQCLMETSAHPSAETIYREITSRMSAVSRNTVYQTLDALEKKRIIFAIIDTDGVRRYDAHTKAHIHLVCLDCGAITDVPYDDRRILGKVKNHFKPEKTVVYIYGRCIGEKKE